MYLSVLRYQLGRHGNTSDTFDFISFFSIQIFTPAFFNNSNILHPSNSESYSSISLITFCITSFLPFKNSHHDTSSPTFGEKLFLMITCVLSPSLASRRCAIKTSAPFCKKRISCVEVSWTIILICFDSDVNGKMNRKSKRLEPDGFRCLVCARSRETGVSPMEAVWLTVLVRLGCLICHRTVVVVDRGHLG